VACVAPVSAGGILPDRVNQIIIDGRFDQPQPQFFVVFSAEPLVNSAGKPMNAASSAELSALATTSDRVVLRLHGKPVSKSGRLDYFFGTLHDGDRPWNNGDEFRWQDWEQHSADVWDHVAIAAAPGTEGRVAAIESVTIRKGGKFLYDSRATKSYPNERPIKVALRPFALTPASGRYPVLNLSNEMAIFRTQYYELGNNPILQFAYADLGQTEKRKYANRGNNWCSEFSSYVYRANGVLTPDPNRGDVHFKSMAEFFRKEGHLYPMREVLTWSDREKIARIKPGSFVSILLGDSTHSLIFTTWVQPERGKTITQYTGVSGNNKGMVWPHEPLSLPTAQDLARKSGKELAEYDERVYFAVPGE
jgi:hypothetical protein